MMLTRCPGCRTTFRIRPDQAKARQGKVRCGQCRHVFNAIEYLVDAVDEAPAKTSAPAALTAQTKVPVTAERAPAVPDRRSPTSDRTAPTLGRKTHPRPPPKVEEEEVEEEEFPDEFSVLGDVAPSARYKGSTKIMGPSPLSEDYFTDDDTTLRDPRRWPWVVGGALAALALIGQAAIAWRVDLATRFPDLREPLAQLCEPFECTVGLPLNASLLKIESSELHPSPQKKGRLELKGTLKNHAPYTQAWPHLELTLTDNADRLVARRALAPDAFIASPEILAAGFPADSEFAVQVQLDVGELPASGYRLYIFYP